MSRDPKTQYHHYIPQFLLRHFAVAPAVPNNHGRNRRRRNKVEKMVNAVDLTTDCAIIGTVPVRRICGEQDMYRDVFTPEKQTRIEDKLGTIEGVAARIIDRVVPLSRAKKDILRKFLFVMKYRSPIFFRRFNHDTADTYDSNDRE
jgi:hypothetical protein